MRHEAQSKMVRSLHFNLHKPGSCMSGHTLVEVLVALALLSSSLAGLAAMNILSYRGNLDAILHTTAVYQAQEIADRMRANPPGMIADGYTSLGSNAGDYPQCLDRVSVTSENAASRRCSAQNIAEFDRHEWLQQIAALLPQGKGSISRKTGASPLPHCSSKAYKHEEIADGAYIISLSWRRAHGQDTVNPTNPIACLNYEFRPSP